MRVAAGCQSWRLQLMTKMKSMMIVGVQMKTTTLWVLRMVGPTTTMVVGVANWRTIEAGCFQRQAS